MPAERPITVRDVMRFTMGFGIQFVPSLPIQQALIEKQMTNDIRYP